MTRFAPLPSLLAKHGAPGVAVAVVERGALAHTETSGLRSATAEQEVNEETVFEAASLSKPCFAFAVLRLVDSGELSLDAPLSTYLGAESGANPRMGAITSRHVLSHTSGLPNTLSEERPLRTWFQPGERFSYSSEGFTYLQKAVERSRGQTLAELMRRLVFEPLGMLRSSYVWREDFAANHALPHDDHGRPSAKWQPNAGNAADSLHTTAPDFARFLGAVLSGKHLEPATARLWLEKVVQVPLHAVECLEPEPALEPHPLLAWGLGWGLEPESGAFFQWGASAGFRAFTLGSVLEQKAIVALTNGETGLRLAAELAASTLPGSHPAFAWLGLDRARKAR